MNVKNIVYAFLAFVLPWILIIAGAAAKVYNPWLYVGCITWLVMALFIFLSFSKF